MEPISQFINIDYSDSEINKIISSPPTSGVSYTCHFNQNEEFFLKLASDFSVPHLPIHHDVNDPTPKSEYLAGLIDVMEQLFSLVPDLFRDLAYVFNPFEILKPRFFRKYQVEGQDYLYILTCDLLYRSQEDAVIEKGTNDRTAHYSTRNLFIEGLFIPLDEVVQENEGTPTFRIKQTLSDTWIGETGRGYFTKGIWMDDDLTKFFTKLLVPKTVRIYPFYPFVCRYKTICENMADLSPGFRVSNLTHLIHALEFLGPFMEDIQERLRDNQFSEEMEFFQNLKSKVPDYWNLVFQDIKIETYLNQNDMREFKVETRIG